PNKCRFRLDIEAELWSGTPRESLLTKSAAPIPRLNSTFEERNNAKLSVKVSLLTHQRLVSRHSKESLILTNVPGPGCPSSIGTERMPCHHTRGSTTHGDLSRLGLLQFGSLPASMVPSRMGL